jgi:hypothetical protein
MITEVQPNETLDGRLQIEGVISRSGMAVTLYEIRRLASSRPSGESLLLVQFSIALKKEIIAL